MKPCPVGTFGLYHALKQVGYDLPRECRDVTLAFPLDGPMILHFECNVMSDDLRKIAQALALMAGRAEE